MKVVIISSKSSRVYYSRTLRGNCTISPVVTDGPLIICTMKIHAYKLMPEVF